MFKMIDQSFQYRAVLQGLCNAEEFVDRLGDIELLDMDWRLLISSKEDSISAYNCTVAAIGRD
jgi:hypothetical protein